MKQITAPIEECFTSARYDAKYGFILGDLVRVA